MLERAIAARRSPTKMARGHAVRVAAIPFLALFAVLAGVVTFLPLPPRVVIAAAPPPPPPLPELATVLPMAWNGPIAAEIGGDESEDFVAVFRHHDGSTVVAAIDGATLEPLWRTPVGSLVVRGPHAYLRRVGSSAVLVTENEARELDLSTGASKGQWALHGQALDLCPFESGEPRAWIEHETDVELLDLEKGSLTPASTPSPLACHGRSDTPLCSTRHVFPCERERTRAEGMLSQVYTAYEDELVVARVGWKSGAPNAPYFGVFTDKKTNRVIWQGRLSLSEDAGHENDFRYAFASGHVILTYKTARAGRRVVAHDTHHGGVAWSAIVGGHGDSLVGLSGTKRRLYLSLHDRILVYDPVTGRELASVASLQGGSLR
jgi:hypothetical protein